MSQILSGVVCGQPPGNPSINDTHQDSQYYEGDNITYQCANGYVNLTGPVNNMCIENGTDWDGVWSESVAPSCTRKEKPIAYNNHDNRF